MNANYSKKEFDGYTHRFVIEFEVGDPYSHRIDIYSDSASPEKLIEFINSKKTQKVKSFKVVHCATKEQDDLSTQLINETLSGI